MSLRTRPEGYGLVAKTLHWVTVAALVVQVVLGYSMDWDDESGSGRGRGRGRGGDSGRGRGRGGRRRGRGRGPGPTRTTPWCGSTWRWGWGSSRSVWRGSAWRRWDSLPAWAEQLSAADRRLATWTERVLLALLVVVPLTGVVLILSGDDDLLGLHVAGHVALYVAVATHLWLVLRRRLLPRMLRRTVGR